MRNRRRCRLHGGKSSGPTTTEGIERIRRASTTHGQRTQAAKAERHALRRLLGDARRVLIELRKRSRESRDLAKAEVTVTAEPPPVLTKQRVSEHAGLFVQSGAGCPGVTLESQASRYRLTPLVGGEAAHVGSAEVSFLEGQLTILDTATAWSISGSSSSIVTVHVISPVTVGVKLGKSNVLLPFPTGSETERTC